jgi:hypothetical protein
MNRPPMLKLVQIFKIIFVITYKALKNHLFYLLNSGFAKHFGLFLFKSVPEESNVTLGPQIYNEYTMNAKAGSKILNNLCY